VSDLRPGTRVRLIRYIQSYAHKGDTATVLEKTKSGCVIVELSCRRRIVVFPGEFEVIADVAGE
jgi:hypothetical protein